MSQPSPCRMNSSICPPSAALAASAARPSWLTSGLRSIDCDRSHGVHAARHKQSCGDAAPSRIRTKPYRPAPDLALRQTSHRRARGHKQAPQPPHPNRPEPESRSACAAITSNRASAGWNQRWRSCLLAAIQVAASPQHKRARSLRPEPRSTSARCRDPYTETQDGC